MNYLSIALLVFISVGNTDIGQTKNSVYKVSFKNIKN
jgi:hypothetical protein